MIQGVILDADSLGTGVDFSPITDLLDNWQVYPSTDPGDVAERVANATVVLSNKIRLDATTTGPASQLRYISVMATGTNNVDLEWARREGIRVSNAVAYATPSVVQHTISLLLALSNNLPAYLADVRAGRWSESNVFCRLDHPIQEVAGKTLGILGYGELGRSVAAAAEGLGLEIVIGERRGQEARQDRMGFEALLTSVDYLSLHCPLTPETQHLLNRETLALMKPGAFVINTARGGLIDSAALIDALQQGQLAGAAIDVLDKEPAASNEPLITDLPNLLVTPHNAWGARESRTRLVNQMAENINGFRIGQIPRLVA